LSPFKINKIISDVVVIGGGTAGCRAAADLSSFGFSVTLVEKANIERSGCLAAGINALNAYVGSGREPGDYAQYALNDAHGLARYDLLLSLSQRLNAQVKYLEDLGLTIHKNQDGSYAQRGWRNVKINGENIKPLLAKAARDSGKVNILERTAAFSLLTDQARAVALVAFSHRDSTLHLIQAKAFICATGGAAGIYKPNNPVSAPNQGWYCPFNSGAGLAMGLWAGAEVTTLEMRFVALRCQDSMAPTGSLALGAGARQINRLGQDYEANYGLTTSQRVLAACKEIEADRGPCLLSAAANREERLEIYRSYLNMSPSQTLKWLEHDDPFDKESQTIWTELSSSEPYVNGGHTAGGLWVDENRRSTIKGLWVAGDAAGGAPQKYATGALAEAEIAALDAADFLDKSKNGAQPNQETIERLFLSISLKLKSYIGRNKAPLNTLNLDEALWEIMDRYAGGSGAHYRYSLASLNQAEQKVSKLAILADKVMVSNAEKLPRLFELKEKITIASALIAHMRERRETRWPGFGQYLDYPLIDDSMSVFINSRLVGGRLKIIHRPLKDFSVNQWLSFWS
jgi:adenylylsulfate reductase subunit A